MNYTYPSQTPEYRRKQKEETNYYKKQYLKNPEFYKSKSREDRLKLKTEVMSHYSNGTLTCMYKDCIFNDIRALEIDHINGNGAEELISISGHNGSGSISGTNFYRYLKNNDYPSGYQVLCRNHQWIKCVENKESNSYNYKNKVI